MELSKTLYNRRAKIKESEEIRMETRRNTRGEYLEDYLRVLYIYRIHIKTKTNDLFKKGKNKIKIQFSFERDTRTFHSKCLQRYNKQSNFPSTGHPIRRSINTFSFNRENNYSSRDKRSRQSHERYWQRYRRDERRRCRYINPRGPGPNPWPRAAEPFRRGGKRSPQQIAADTGGFKKYPATPVFN